MTLMKEERQYNLKKIIASAALVLTSFVLVPPIATFARRRLNTAVKPCNGVTARLTTALTLPGTVLSVIKRSTGPGQGHPTQAATGEIADVTVVLTNLASKKTAQTGVGSHTVAVVTKKATMTAHNHLRRHDLSSLRGLPCLVAPK